jgi:hypothetical protein
VRTADLPAAGQVGEGAGGGRPHAATAAYREVRDAFAARKIPYDTGLVTLELAAHLLEHGETAAVRTLAAESAAIFRAREVDRERCGALLLFCQAAEREPSPWSWCAGCSTAGAAAVPDPAH